MTTIAETRQSLARAGIIPGAMSCREAAAYVGLCETTFLAEVAAGTLPPPLPLKSRRKRWSRAALDRALGVEQSAAATPEDLAAAIDKAIENYAA